MKGGSHGNVSLHDDANARGSSVIYPACLGWCQCGVPSFSLESGNNVTNLTISEFVLLDGHAVKNQPGKHRSHS